MNKKSKSYYGPFFWLAAVSFIVPLFVAHAAFRNTHPPTTPAIHLDASGVDHALWDYLLKKYVENGLIDYDGMEQDYLFRTYLNQLGQAQPAKLKTEAEQLALLCNAYNAFVIDGVISHGIRSSVMDYQQDGKEFFDIPEHIFGNLTVSLNDIEHRMIRERFHEPRIHVALVCAARSCPVIRREAYIGSRLSAQLEDQAYVFANNRTYVDFDEQQNQLKLSPILQWYGEDWDVVGGYLPWLVKRIENSDLREAVSCAMKSEVDIVFFEYDWSLNSQFDPTADNSTSSDGTAPSRKANPPQKQKTDFGSGSIPNG